MSNDWNLLIRDIQRAEQALIPELMTAENKTAEKGLAVAHKLSSGSIPTATLAAPVASGGLGHPYGHGSTGAAGPRGPIPYNDPSVINRQTGAFYAAWLMLMASKSGNVISTVIANFDIAANFLSQRTRFAIRRPIDDRIVRDTAALRLKNLDNAARKIFRFK